MNAILTILLLAVVPAANETPGDLVKAATALDRHGDPLPANAIARLGTVRLRHSMGVRALAFTRDGQALASIGGNESNLLLWQVPSGKVLARLPNPPAVPGSGLFLHAVAFSEDGKTMAIADNDGTKGPGKITFFDFSPGRPDEHRPPALGKDRYRFKVGEDVPIFLAFLPDGNLLGGTREGRVYLWDLDGKEVQRFGNPGTPTVDHAFAVAADGKKLDGHFTSP